MNDKPYIVVAYYTVGTLYEAKAKILQRSLERFDVPYYIEAVPNLGTWHLNTSFKPTFLKSMFNKFDEDLVYVDVDAEFQRYPDLFDTLGSAMNHSIAAYVFDRSCYKRSVGGFELLSGTLYITHTPNSYKVLEEWEDRTQRFTTEWDQKSLEFVLDGDFDLLPGEYCKIFDRMETVTDPVIVHFQASREVRKHRGNLV
jgi:hypothetical protein